MKLDENIDIEEMEDYKSETSSTKQIALQFIKKIGDIMCQELTPGIWEKKPVKVGSGIIMTEVYKPDLRIAFCNAVDFVVYLVYPYADDEYKNYIKSIWDKEEEETPKIDDKIKIRMKMFRESNIMFERWDFFDTSEGRTES